MAVNVISAPNYQYSFNSAVDYRIFESIDLSAALDTGGLAGGGPVLSENDTIGIQHDGRELRIYEIDTEKSDNTQRVLYTIGLSENVTTVEGDTLAISADGLNIGAESLIVFDNATTSTTSTTTTTTTTSYQLRVHRHSEKLGQTEVLVQICAVHSDGDGTRLETVYRDFNQVSTSSEPYALMPGENMVYAYDTSLTTYKKDPEIHGANYRLVGLGDTGEVLVTFDFIDATTEAVPTLYMTGPQSNFQHRVYSDAKKGFEFFVERYILLQYKDDAIIDFKSPETMEEVTHQLETLGGTNGVSAINVDYFLLDYENKIVTNGGTPTKTAAGTLIVLAPTADNNTRRIIGYCHDTKDVKDIPDTDSDPLRILLNSQKFQEMMDSTSANPTVVRIISDSIVPALNNQTVLVTGKLL